MNLFKASKKQPTRNLSKLWSCKVLITLGLIFSVSSVASISPSGSVTNHPNYKATYFFSSKHQSPSYIIRYTSGESDVDIKNAKDSYQYKIKSGIITDATFEKHIQNFRIIGILHLQGNRYQLKRLILTNKSVFFANGSCSSPRT